jgi:hypothetical protein
MAIRHILLDDTEKYYSDANLSEADFEAFKQLNQIIDPLISWNFTRLMQRNVATGSAVLEMWINLDIHLEQHAYPVC